VPGVRGLEAPVSVRALTVRFGACWALVAALLVVSPAQASWRRYRVADAPATLQRVNALRASFGAPPLSLVRAWSNGCARHIAYTRRNPFGHAEQPGRPGYTRSGAVAGVTSVLVSPPEEPFASRFGAWANEPYHQVQVLNPRLARTGFSLGCMNTMRGMAAPPPAGGPPALLAWPGDGAAGVPRSLDACDELPSDPFTDVGWGCSRAGAALYVYARAARCTAAPAVRITARGGSIPLRVLPDSPCTWIVITGQALPPAAAVTFEVSLAGLRLRHTFATR
jgi:hypothetical protein